MAGASNWLKQLDYCDMRKLTRALIAAFDEIETRYGKASAEKWTRHTKKYRVVMVNVVTEFWSRETGMDDDEFPFNDDFVAMLYLRWRKTGDDDKQKIRAAFGFSSPLIPSGSAS